MKKEARLVIVGAGIVGCSAAYHLTKRGWRDIVVVDKGPLWETGGSTSHAPGLMFLTNGSRTMTRLAMYSRDLYAQLDYHGEKIFWGVGGIELARSKARFVDLRRRQGWATAWGLESHLLTPEECQARVPLLNAKAIAGGYFVPGDCDVSGWRVAGAMGLAAMATGGAEFCGDTAVLDFEMKGNRPAAVVTDKGTIRAEMVLLCTNVWGTVLAEKMGIKLPLRAVQHLYAVTQPIPELAGATDELEHPILREQDTSMYLRQHRQAYGIGSYRHAPLVVHPREVGKTATLPFTPEHLTEAHAATKDILPAVGRAELARAFNGMFVFTVDGNSVLGPAPGLENVWVANGTWVTHAGGMGMVLAEWMDAGEPSMDLHEIDISRFHRHMHSPVFTARCVAQQYREVYDIIHPMQTMEHTRNVRLAPYHARLEGLQANLVTSVGWERPLWYGANAGLVEAYGARVPERTGWEARFWSPIQGAEHLATRERVGLFELSAFVKIEVSGAGAAAFLESLCANRVARGVGKVVYTAMLDTNGGIACDLTIVRLAEDRFWVLTGGGAGMHDLEWIRRHVPPAAGHSSLLGTAVGGVVRVADVSSQYTGVGLWGPRARDVLQACTGDDVSHGAFPYFSAREFFVENVPVIAARISYAGELGWELYAPAECGLKLWDVLWEAGQAYGMVAAGMGAFDSLRLEKGYRFWGQDIHTEYNPDEAGLGWAVRMDKGDFLGREALVAARAKGISRKFCCMTFDGAEAMALGKEPIFAGGACVGYVTSTNYGYSVGKHILYGYLPVRHAAVGTKVEVEYFGRRHAATVVSEPLYDAGMAKLKG